MVEEYIGGLDGKDVGDHLFLAKWRATDSSELCQESGSLSTAYELVDNYVLLHCLVEVVALHFTQNE